MYEYFPSFDDEQPYTAHRLIEERESIETLEPLGDYMVTIHSDPEGESWIGVSPWGNVELDDVIDLKVPQSIWKFQEDGSVRFCQQRPDDGSYLERKPATNVDSLLIHVLNLVEQKQGHPGSDNPKLREKYNQLVGKLIDRSLRK